MNKHDFDFSLGEWEGDVLRYAPDGTVVADTRGSWSSRASLGGRVIEDNFIQHVDGGDDIGAFTVRTYCEETQRWEMVFLWSGQQATGLTAFVGNRVGDEMHLSLQRVGATGVAVISRIRFHEITNDSFTWENQTSMDNGATWFRAMHLKLRRRKEG